MAVTKRRYGTRVVAALTPVVAALGCGGPRMSTSIAPPHLLMRGTEPEVRVWVDAEAREVVVDMGPFAAPAMDEGHQGHADAHGTAGPMMRFEWPVEGWLRGFQVAVTDEEGKELPRHLLHHLIGVNYDRRQLVYPALERFFGIGSETRDVELPKSIGVPMERGQRLGLYASLHNDTGRDFPAVYIRVAMDYTAAAERRDVTSVLPVYFDTNNEVGGDNAWDVAPGRSEMSWEFTPPVSGDLLAATGHLHEHGEHVRLEDAETGRTLVRLDAVEDEHGRLETVETRVFRKWLGLRPDPLRLEAGRRYRVVGVYDNPTGETLPDAAMAHIVGIFVPDDMGEWPELDPSSEVLRRDIAALPQPPGARDRAEHGHAGHGGEVLDHAGHAEEAVGHPH